MVKAKATASAMIRLINLSSSQTVSQEHLPLQANGYHCTSEMLYDVLMKAASENISIDAACRDLEQSASGNRIREYLNEQLNVEQLEL